MGFPVATVHPKQFSMPYFFLAEQFRHLRSSMDIHYEDDDVRLLEVIKKCKSAVRVL